MRERELEYLENAEPAKIKQGAVRSDGAKVEGTKVGSQRAL